MKWYNCYIHEVSLRCAEEQAATSEPETGHWIRGGAGGFSHPYYLDQRSDVPEQYRAIGWVGSLMYSVIFEMREDKEGECYHLVTLWKATKQEQRLYADHA